MRPHPRTAVLVTLVLLGAGRAAHAEEAGPSKHGFEIGFRTGVAFPIGDASSGVKLSDGFGVQFPLWVDVGYRFDDLVLGAYGQWAPGVVGGQIDCGNVGCSAHAWRAGLEVQIHPTHRRGKVDPWLSLGFGYEWDTLNASQFNGTTQVSASVTLHGWDIARIGGGVDFALTPHLRVGPFVHATVSEFVETSVSVPGFSQSSPISQKAVHSWITVGVRVTGLL